MKTLQDAIEERKVELEKVAREIEIKRKLETLAREQREQDAVAAFKKVLSEEYEFDASELDVRARDGGCQNFNITIYIDGIRAVSVLGGFDGLLANVNKFRGHKEGYHNDYVNFIDAWIYAAEGE